MVLALTAGLATGACSTVDGGLDEPASASAEASAEAGAPAGPSQAAAPTSPPTTTGDAAVNGAAAAAARPSTEPRAVTGWGPTMQQWRRAGVLVADMSVEEQAGQVIVATYAGLEPPLDLVRELRLGGVILMGDNVPTGAGGASSMERITRRLREAADRPFPVIVAVDQEGGPVARLGPPVTEFPPGMAHGAANDRAVSRTAARASGTELAALGFTMVFAPVADVTMAGDPTIGVRSPGDRPALVSRVAVAQAQGFERAGVVPVLKHFPGHGSVPADSHVELPVQTAPVDRLTQRDLRPFAAAVDAGVPAMMVAHIDVRAVDAGVPASLSRPVVTGVLRDQLGFEGVVVTDSLGMAAVADRSTAAESAVAALRAGADLLLMPPDARAARDGIVAAVRSGGLPRDRLVEAARRVVALQLYQRSSAQRPALSVVGSRAEASRALSERAVTVMDGPCTGPYVGSSIRIAGGTSTDRERLRAAADAAGLGTGAGDLVVLMGAGSTASGDVVVALDTPYGLARSSAATASLALFGRTPQAFEVLVDVLTGRAEAPGTLPVRVDGARRQPC